jgi:hypothetical protein
MQALSHFIARRDLLWRVFDFAITPFYRQVGTYREQYVSEFVSSAIDCLSPDLRVLSGPFTGLQYARKVSFVSTLAPKLLGTYESELHDLMNDKMTNPYDVIIDVGCAEGYYAVGFAKRTQLPVLAFDILPAARIATKEMALANAVEHLVEINSYCTYSELSNRTRGRRCLVLCDAEGYEEELFQGASIEALVDSDVIIECHDMLVANVTQTLYGRFRRTHSINIIQSMSDHERPSRALRPCLQAYTAYEQRLLLSERRPSMNWLVASSLSNV